MDRIDFKKEFKELYSPPAKSPVLVEVPEFQFLAIDGEGDPNTAPAYRDAITALYSLSYTMKFMLKKAGTVDYGVPPLEGLWWADDMAEFSEGRKDEWKWLLLIMQPQQVTGRLLDDAREQVLRKKEATSPDVLDKVRLERFHEGLCAQVMHIGPYAAEAPTVSMLHQFIEQQGYTLRGRHHEIYIGDPNRSVPEKLKTVIRQPVARALP
jgi:hypothetical protein